MWSSWTESAKASLQQAIEKTGDALEKTGEVLTQAATHHPPTQKQQQQQEQQEQEKQKQQEKSKEDNATMPASSTFASLMSSVVESTKHGLQQAQQVMEEQQHKLQAQLDAQRRQSIPPRPLSMPLDVAALQDAHVVYVTDRIVTLAHPFVDSSSDGDLTAERKVAAVAHLLQKRHAGRYMVWNLSEVDYPVDLLEHQVLVYKFPGSPSPPLGMLLQILMSLESWLNADSRNVAVLHCLTGKGRSSTVVAAFLCWMHQAGFGTDVQEALSYIAQCKQISPTSDLTIPSQRRYMGYFQTMLHNKVRPSAAPLWIRRVILSQAPKFARGPLPMDKEGKDLSEAEAEQARWGCAPYLQLFQHGKLLFTTPASLTYPTEQQEEEGEKKTKDTQTETKPEGDTDSKDPKITEPSSKKSSNTRELPFCHMGGGTVSFHVGQMVQGDVLLRARHLTAQRARVSMFRAAFHTGFVGGNVLRLTKEQLDGACQDDDRFPNDFYVDIILEPVTAAEQAAQQQQEKEMEDDNEVKEEQKEQGGEPTDETKPMVSKDEKAVDEAKATTITATQEDSLLDRDSRFWQVIVDRQKQQEEMERQKQESQENETPKKEPSSETKTKEDDPFWGPTVGRRRRFDKPSEKGTQDGSTAPNAAVAATANSSNSSFSILGSEFDFLPQSTAAPSSAAATASIKKPVAKPKPKRDTLMEALSGVLMDDDHDDQEDKEDDIHEIVFTTQDTASETASGGNEKKQTASNTETADAGKESTQNTSASASTTAEPNTEAKSTSTASDKDDDAGDDGAEHLLSNLASLSLDEDDVNALLTAGGAGDDIEDVDDNMDDDFADLENLLTQKK